MKDTDVVLCSHDISLSLHLYTLIHVGVAALLVSVIQNFKCIYSLICKSFIRRGKRIFLFKSSAARNPIDFFLFLASNVVLVPLVSCFCIFCNFITSVCFTGASFHALISKDASLNVLGMLRVIFSFELLEVSGRICLHILAGGS